MWTLKDLSEFTTYQRTSIFRLMRESDFPKGILLSARRRVWDPEEVKSWIASNKTDVVNTNTK